jgi:hypothetical protein
MSALATRVEAIPQAIAEDVESEDQHRDRRSRKKREVRGVEDVPACRSTWCPSWAWAAARDGREN